MKTILVCKCGRWPKQNPDIYIDREGAFCPTCGAEFQKEKPKIIVVFVKAEGHWSDDGVYVTLHELKKLLEEIK